MVITLGPDLEAILNDLARQQGVTPEALALKALRKRFSHLPRRQSSHGMTGSDACYRSLPIAESHCPMKR